MPITKKRTTRQRQQAGARKASILKNVPLNKGHRSRISAGMKKAWAKVRRTRRTWRFTGKSTLTTRKRAA
jgi:hypothetical protein